MQTTWLNWDELDRLMSTDFNWRKILHCYSDDLLCFNLNLHTNSLPSPDNLHRWYPNRNFKCGLCGNLNVTIGHILAGCPFVRARANQKQEDRYTWRHNCLLACFASALDLCLQQLPKVPAKKSNPQISFVSEGAPVRHASKRPRFSFIGLATDWRWDFHLPEWNSFGSYVFPPHICLTDSLPDGFLYSNSLKVCFVFELTSPLEENIPF